MKKITFSFMLMIALLLLLSGVTLAAEEAIVEMNGTTYDTIQEAIDAVPNEGTATITLLKDVEDGHGFKIGKKNVEWKNITIDFAGHTYNIIDSDKLVGSSGTQTLGAQLNLDSTVVLKNGTFKSKVAKMLVQNYSDLTLKDMTLDTLGGIATYTLSNNCGEVLITGNTSIKGENIAFDVCWASNVGYVEGAQVTVDTTGEIIGDIELATWDDSTDTSSTKNTLAIKNIEHNGDIVPRIEAFKEQISITGGTFSSDVTEYQAEGYVGKEINGSYVFGKENKINLGAVENGTISADKATAIAGETVTLKAKAAQDYELKAITVTDVNGKAVEVKDNKFVMPDADVTVKAEFIKMVSEGGTAIGEAEEEKDDTPKTGVVTTFTVFTVIAAISLAGLVLVKKSK